MRLDQDSISVPRIAGHLLSVLLLLILSACADSNEAHIREVCIAANRAGNSQQVSDRCTCFAESAKKYLDKEDYALLAKSSEIYLSDRSDGEKVDAVTRAFLERGQDPIQAGIGALDFVMLVHKVSRECAI